MTSWFIQLYWLLASWRRQSAPHRLEDVLLPAFHPIYLPEAVTIGRPELDALGGDAMKALKVEAKSASPLGTP